MSEIIGLAGWLIAAAAVAHILARRPAAQPIILAQAPAVKAPSDYDGLTLQEMMQELDAPNGRQALARRMRQLIDHHGCNAEVSLFCIAVEPDGYVSQHSSSDTANVRLAIDALLDLHDEHAPRHRDATNSARRCLGIKVSEP